MRELEQKCKSREAAATKRTSLRAAMEGQLDGLKLLIDAGADTRKADLLRNTPLMAAAA